MRYAKAEELDVNVRSWRTSRKAEHTNFLARRGDLVDLPFNRIPALRNVILPSRDCRSHGEELSRAHMSLPK